MRLAGLSILLIAATVLSGCATFMNAQRAAPKNEGEVEEYKYGIYDARAAWINDEGFVVVCIVGEVLGRERASYSLVLRTNADGLPYAQISQPGADQAALPHYNMAPREIGEPCEYSPHGRSIPLIALDLTEPEHYEHTPVTKPQLLDWPELRKKRSGLAVINLKRAEYCAEVILWNSAAETADIEFVRISTPTAQLNVKRNRAWYLMMPFTVLFDVVTFPIQVVALNYGFIHTYGKAHMAHC